ncbi:type IVB secretion system protein IcmH/DotU [Methylovirgula sp. 4M-Z18]|uniref:type IVB secretion system protein IcmH/DotU n=1 Tax=Methylovirgula sp. 4M-Z18 TaxID=2293567 RepID=UPI0018F6FE31|nr:type IVB secretion system protein IcmH/DotU [Methylovirgula sp. 4M-Z18]
MGASDKTGGPNPILEAAMPLLIVLANIRIARQVPQVAPMMNTVALGIENFETSLNAQNIPEPQVRTAKYALCATADDIVQNLPSSDRNLWTQYSMLSRFFQVRDSGVGFFDELAKLRQNPQINHNLLGLMHACMSLGFEGKYRIAGGNVAHQQIRRDIYETLRAREARATDHISPHWRGQDIAAAYVRQAVPLWAVTSAAAGLLLLSFLVFRWLLGGLSDSASANLLALHPTADIHIYRTVPAPPPPPPPIKVTTQLERIRERLKDDIAANKVSADYSGKDIVVRLLNDSLFDKGSTTVRADAVPVIGHIAGALEKEPGQIRIVGHTDSTPVRATVRYKDNQQLSEQRAQAVQHILVEGISDPKRLTTAGLADTAPIDMSNTVEGNARNRRVEVFIPREDM